MQQRETPDFLYTSGDEIRCISQTRTGTIELYHAIRRHLGIAWDYEKGLGRAPSDDLLGFLQTEHAEDRAQRLYLRDPVFKAAVDMRVEMMRERERGKTTPEHSDESGDRR